MKLTPPLRIRWNGRLYKIADDRVLWMVSEVARTSGTNGFLAKHAQMRVRGLAGNRHERTQLVVNMKTGRLVKPDPKYFVREDPYQGREGK